MIRHVMRLAWNRKRQNALLLAELVGSFLVLLVLSAVTLVAIGAYYTPLGFEHEDIWVVKVMPPDQGLEMPSESDPEDDNGPTTYLPETLMREVESFDAVQSSAMTLFPLFSTSGMRTSREIDGEALSMEMFGVSLGALETLGIEISEGRWLDESDFQDPHEPMVINRRLADRLFGPGSHPAGELYTPPESGNDRSFRIVGVTEHFRKAGDASPEGNIILHPLALDEPPIFPYFRLLLAMKPGSEARLEEAMVEHLRGVAPGWEFEIEALTDIRRKRLQEVLSPILIGGLVATFLLIMVGLGLTGVLWQNVIRRTREIGLRRAQGATAAEVRHQILLELQMLTLMGLVIGGALAAQLPLLGLGFIDLVSASNLFRAYLLSSALMLLLTTLCGLYPSWLATRVQPAEALRYE